VTQEFEYAKRGFYYEDGTVLTKTSDALIPRQILFGNPDRAQVQLSPDGTTLAWLAPRAKVLNIWVSPREELQVARPITDDTGRGIRFFIWAQSSNRILFIQDANGDENWRLFSVEVESSTIRDLTPFANTTAEVVAISHKFPDEIIVGLNNRDPHWHDIYRLNIVSGELTLLLQHDRFAGILMDSDYRIRNAVQVDPGGVTNIYSLIDTEWKLWDSIPSEDQKTTWPISYDQENRYLYMKESRGRNTSALVIVDPETMSIRTLAEDSVVDAWNFLYDPTGTKIQAVSFIHTRKRWQILDPSISSDLDYLRMVEDGDFDVQSRSHDDRFWVVVYVLDDGPIHYYLYDRKQRVARFLFSNRAALEGLSLAKMHPVVIRSRDGLDLVSYYSLPPGSDSNGDGIPDAPLPMILIPHGGPWTRDYWGFNSQHQWFANRGYAVLSVNFRCSVGFGKVFVNAGNHEWGGKVLEDQIDAVNWAIEQGIAEASKVAIFGGSFGGYSALAGLTFTPEFFACGVDIVGPSNLITLLETTPPYWKPVLEDMTARIGDHRTKEGRALLEKHSPLTYADRICRPLLIGQGANDPRVKKSESDQIVQAMRSKGIPVAYVLFPDEGHGFAKPENRISFYALAEAFLGECLKGLVEPIGEDFSGSSLEVLSGQEILPMLAKSSR
jgi:dipeptidyl aminopeptidase/acylaminoacyl peptidase